MEISSTTDVSSCIDIPAHKLADSYNTESGNDIDLQARPLKKAKCFELNKSESENHFNVCDPSLSLPSPTISASSLVSSFESSIVEKKNCCQSSGFESDGKQLEKHEQFEADQTYDYLPQDYARTDIDCCAQITIETSITTNILVKIDDVFVTKSQLMCLLDTGTFLNGNVINAYICCIKDQAHLRSRNDTKFYFENTLTSAILKRDGNLGIKEDGNYVTDIVASYLNHDVVLVPINIKDTHWYLAIINAQKCEIQILDSLCWEFNRADLTATVTTWTITEQLHEPMQMQKDSSSCGVFMLKFMEYWTEDSLYHPITQKDITHFRYKLAGILLCWKRNIAGTSSHLEQVQATEANSIDALTFGSPHGQKGSKSSESLSLLSEEMKYQSLMSILCKMSVQELIGGLCSYIKSINCSEALEKVWVKSSKQYSINLTLRKPQEILKKDLPMDRDCFNLVIRKFMFDDIQFVKKAKGTISKHYLDTQFWLDVEQLADLFVAGLVLTTVFQDANIFLYQ